MLVKYPTAAASDAFGESYASEFITRLFIVYFIRAFLIVCKRVLITTSYFQLVMDVYRNL